MAGLINTVFRPSASVLFCQLAVVYRSGAGRVSLRLVAAVAAAARFFSRDKTRDGTERWDTDSDGTIPSRSSVLTVR